MSSDIQRGFYHTGAAYYARSSLAHTDYVDEVMIGDYPEGGGTRGEFSVRWYSLGNEATPSPRIEVFGDTFAVLPHFQDLLAELAKPERRSIQANELVALLTNLGFVDLTDREGPEGHRAGITKEFFVVVTERDYDKHHFARDPSFIEPDRGPIVFEAYLNQATYETASKNARSLGDKYGWARVGKLIVEDWPEESK